MKSSFFHETIGGFSYSTLVAEIFSTQKMSLTKHTYVPIFNLFYSTISSKLVY